MQQLERVVALLRDAAQAPESHAAGAAWLAASIAKFEGWRRRIVAPVPQ